MEERKQIAVRALMAINRILEREEITQTALAGKLDCKPAKFTEILKGRMLVPTEMMSALCGQYGVSADWLLNGEGEMFNDAKPGKKLIPLYEDVSTIGGHNETVADVDDPHADGEMVDAGDWFPGATAAIYHYGDSMVEYPSGCILVLKRVNNPRLLINGENYVIETEEFRITKQILDEGDDYITAYSSNRETHPDGRLVHAPIRIPKESIRHMDLVVGCVIKKFSNPARIK